MFCSKCGARCAEGSKFCRTCGAPITRGPGGSGPAISGSPSKAPAGYYWSSPSPEDREAEAARLRRIESHEASRGAGLAQSGQSTTTSGTRAPGWGVTAMVGGVALIVGIATFDPAVPPTIAWVDLIMSLVAIACVWSDLAWKKKHGGANPQ
jgi:hypothetical protein